MISRKDWYIAGIITLLAITLLQLPYIAGYRTTPPDKVYTGLIMNPEDSQTYFAKMRQGYEGEWLYTISFTPEPHQPALVGVFYLGLGHIARVLGGTITDVWHGGRIIAGIFLFTTTFWYITRHTQNRRTVWIAFLLAIFGSGLGWLLFVFGQTYWLGTFPVDFKMPESHLFFMAMTFPHVAIGTALTLIIFHHLQKIIDHHTTPSPYHPTTAALLPGILNLAIAIIYPFLIYLITAVTGVYTLLAITKNNYQLSTINYQLILAFLIPAPLIGYYALVLRQNPIFAAWNTQAGLPSPHVFHYLVAFGILLLLAGIGWKQSKQHRFLWVWVLMAALLVYIPVEAQRRFVQGVQVPLSILAAIGLVEVVMPAFFRTNLLHRILQSPRYTQAKLEHFLTTLFLLFMALSNIYLLFSISITAAVQQPPEFFRTQAEYAGIQWLTTTPHTDVLLSSYSVGNYAAAHAGNQVVIGHWAETLNFAEKEQAVAQFYDPATTDTWRKNLVTDMNVAYVWADNDLLDNIAWLMPAFHQDNITIYRVIGR